MRTNRIILLNPATNETFLPCEFREYPIGLIVPMERRTYDYLQEIFY